MKRFKILNVKHYLTLKYMNVRNIKLPLQYII